MQDRHYSTNNSIMPVMKTLHNVMILLCIVSVDARLDVNVALNRSSYHFDATSGYYAAYANDGNHDTVMYNGHCMATGIATNPWWAVDLLVALYVVGVKFTNRGDCCGTYASSDSSVPSQHHRKKRMAVPKFGCETI